MSEQNQSIRQNEPNDGSTDHVAVQNEPNARWMREKRDLKIRTGAMLSLWWISTKLTDWYTNTGLFRRGRFAGSNRSDDARQLLAIIIARIDLMDSLVLFSLLSQVAIEKMMGKKMQPVYRSGRSTFLRLCPADHGHLQFWEGMTPHLLPGQHCERCGSSE